ncbi:hypothetical protein ACNHKD_17120 [Methylocystis sp. JAN1]|uniref:hypothetical protein n=1 Tax=Methylocystis sp. JAN1 TaxID=3397211 RepID=UPI003FA1D983
MRQKTSPPASEKIAQAKLLYDAGAPIAQITALLGVSAKQFLAFREKNDWPKRVPVCPRKSGPAKSAPAPVDPDALIPKLEDAVAREFARVETALEKQAPKTIEASARALATLVKTLAELKRMRREADETKEDATRPDDDRADEPPRELAELRAELARRLERLRGGGPPG